MDPRADLSRGSDGRSNEENGGTMMGSARALSAIFVVGGFGRGVHSRGFLRGRVGFSRTLRRAIRDSRYIETENPRPAAGDSFPGHQRRRAHSCSTRAGACLFVSSWGNGLAAFHRYAKTDLKGQSGSSAAGLPVPGCRPRADLCSGVSRKHSWPPRSLHLRFCAAGRARAGQGSRSSIARPASCQTSRWGEAAGASRRAG